jgi:hypothetical protein
MIGRPEASKDCDERTQRKDASKNAAIKDRDSKESELESKLENSATHDEEMKTWEIALYLLMVSWRGTCMSG